MRSISLLSFPALALTGLFLLLNACSGERKPVKGFVLPQGDVEKGQEVFLAFNCNGCHDVAGVALPERQARPPFVVELGGEVSRVKDYGELLTAVVNPNHQVSLDNKSRLEKAGENPSQTPMPYFGDLMTVTELTDLVEFLHAQYSLRQPEVYRGHYYYVP